MKPSHRAPNALAAACLLALLIAGCGRAPEAGSAGAAPAAASGPQAPTLSLGPEDIWTVGSGGGAAAPAITGTIQAERRADLRAEMASVVQRVTRDSGERVRRGELLVKLDDAAVRESLASADEALRAATRSLEGADRTLERLKSLQAQGMTSLQATEDAEVRRNLAQSEVVAARARLAAARQQLERTEVRAPFDGVVAARKVSAGDTATMGKELVQVIDPSSLRLEALVSAQRVGELRPGQAVKVRIQGAAAAAEASWREGRIRRIDAVAQPVSRQVAVVVDLVGGADGLMAGLYAEGSVDSPVSQTIAIPETAVVRDGQQAFVWTLDGQTLRRQPVTLEPRDPRTGLLAVGDGLKEGQRILRSPGTRPVEGQSYSVRQG